MSGFQRAQAFRGGDQHGLIPRAPESPTDAASADAFVRGFGLRAFRRPLTDDEAARYAGLLLEEAARSRDFQAGASIVIEAIAGAVRGAPAETESEHDHG